MLILGRQTDERIVITTPSGDELEVTVVGIKGNRVRLGFEAPKQYAVHRKEVQDQIKRHAPRKAG